jgi:hypothetical protein
MWIVEQEGDEGLKKILQKLTNGSDKEANI